MPSLRVHRASDEFARELASRVGRWLLVALGGVVMIAAVPLSALPGHLGVPLFVIGLMIVLRNSFKAKRQFVRIQRAHPKMVFPLRRLMRRDPEILPVVWQQYLRLERLVLPRRARFAVRCRRALSGRRRASAV
ncbi:MAG: hypothetical protein JWR47_3440 [Phenylobacterium sp.]|jgi:hypothetical protein|uniref:hypothetical protein n=1 Tax=Phenylobacterium sp. TaxID=1871053 RepID=UPI002613202F|nr:hypothetical protein [Phenylobacterium sp.]MDB5437183.1 hypothetical protein [Phenylobacterium sp.]MDB5462587.1 hypothetical protein [Phenylobacterium sp.]MDB5498910.1 hypothetical protein [Phenylobacterium sp.]